LQQAKEAEWPSKGWNQTGADKQESSDVGDANGGEPQKQLPEPRPGQPTPGVFVHRSTNNACHEAHTSGEYVQHYPTEPAADNAGHFLKMLRRHLRDGANEDAEPASSVATPRLFGVLLDYDGADLRCFSTRSLAGEWKSAPQACVMILGGPKGISAPFQKMVRDTFQSQNVPLVSVCLGPEQQMAHACIAYLRLEEDAKRLRPALLDLLRLGQKGYTKLCTEIEESMHRAIAARRGTVRRGKRRVLIGKASRRVLLSPRTKTKKSD